MPLSYNMRLQVCAAGVITDSEYFSSWHRGLLALLVTETGSRRRLGQARERGVGGPLSLVAEAIRMSLKLLAAVLGEGNPPAKNQGHQHGGAQELSLLAGGCRSPSPPRR